MNLNARVPQQCTRQIQIRNARHIIKTTTAMHAFVTLHALGQIFSNVYTYIYIYIYIYMYIHKLHPM